MNAPNSPLPPQQTCPNCGTVSPLDYALCPRCGMQLSAPSKAMYGCATLLFQTFLATLALIFGASGACFALFGVSDGTDSLDLLLIGLVLFGLTYLCVWLIVRINKSRK